LNEQIDKLKNEKVTTALRDNDVRRDAGKVPTLTTIEFEKALEEKQKPLLIEFKNLKSQLEEIKA
jgi:hypothetical protein